MHAVNADGAGHVAKAAAAAGASSLVHISAIGADPDGASRYAQSKGKGEAAVRAAFPTATIIRPSLVFGAEDQLTNRFAGLLAMLPLYPVIAPKTRFQPVYVRDLAPAIAAAALDPGRASRQDLRDRRAAGDDDARADRRDRRPPPASRPSWSTCPISPPA